MTTDPGRDSNATLGVLVAIAMDAAKIAKNAHDQRNFQVEWKGKGDPVTNADREANELIVVALRSAFPGIPIVAEESAVDESAAYSRSEHAFFVDPIDGTKDFVEGRDEFCVMIGLSTNGAAALGVVVHPPSGDVFVGGNDVPARRIRASGEEVAIHVSATEDLERARCAVSRSHRTPEVDARLQRLGCAEYVPLGSAGLKQVRVASGEFDLYVHLTSGMKLWDACAPHAILRAAGGELVTSRGEPIDYRSELPIPHGVAAGNRGLVASAVSTLATARGV